jgi:hypothetical protein
MIAVIFAMWCGWSDWSVHSPDKCAPTRAACEQIAKKKKTKAECVNWLS